MQRGRARVERVGGKVDYAVHSRHIGALAACTPRPRQFEILGCLARVLFQKNLSYASLSIISSR
jgi:hypothetical protein